MIRTSKSIPPFEQNAVLKLIILVGSCFAAYKLAMSTMMVAGSAPGLYEQYFTYNLAMPPLKAMASKPWTIFTHGLIHECFWLLFSNMIWLYAFGSLVQMLVGHRQVIPLFLFALLMGGIFYTLAQLIPGGYFLCTNLMVGCQAGIVGLAVAAITLSPGYKYYLSETMRIPLWLIAAIFFALQLVNVDVARQGAPLFMLLGGAFAGFAYVVLLKNGYRPVGWVYDIIDKTNTKFEPNERAFTYRADTRRNKTISMYSPKPSQGITQTKIDMILDKINQKGYDSLSKEDKETLMNASGKGY